MDEPPSIDPVAARRWTGQTPATAPWLHQEVARRMAERLPWISLPVRHWVHWGPVGGGASARALVAAHYPGAECFEVAASAPTARSVPAPWWQRLTRRRRASRRAATGPVPPEAAAQLVWANMQLHQAADPRALMADWLRALAVDGFLMFSCFGPDTLRELRALYQNLGWPPPAHEFTDMHDWGDQLFRVGFADPVMDMEHITLTFDTPARLLQELRGLGRNLHAARHAALRTPAWRQRLEQALDAHLRPEPGAPLTLTFEIIYGHALKPASRATRSVAPPPIDFSPD